MRVWTWATIVLLALTLSSCASKSGSTVPPTPLCTNGVNAFDCTTFQTLFTIQAAIEQAKIGIPDSKKVLLNKVIDGYNAAQISYAAYHKLAVAGSATPAQQAALQTQVLSLKADVATLGAK